MTNTSAEAQAVNVSGPLRTVAFAGQMITTGFFKTTMSGKLCVNKLGILGDAQGDLTVHGGPEKAVYFYPQEHYLEWERVLDSGTLPSGAFGENITSKGITERDLSVGDILQIGTTTLQVIQPRSPCFKLQIRFGRPDMTALFFRQGRPGWYASVLQEGDIAAGDQINLVSRAPESVSIADVWSCSAHGNIDKITAERVMGLELLPEFWKQRIRRNVLNEAL